MLCFRALLECYVGSHEKVHENAVSALQYVQKNAPQYYKQMFSLIVSLSFAGLKKFYSVV